MNKTKIKAIFTRFREHTPHPKTELIYRNEFELLIAVILSAQATDISVNKATKALFNVAPSPEKMLALGEENLRQYIKTIGLYRNKAKNIILCCQRLIYVFDSQVPNKREDLESLAGVGRKTANVVLNTAFGQLTMAVDTHIFRVSNRTHIAPGKNVLEVEQKLVKVIPKEFMKDAHHWLILHGRYVCKARKPLCRQCVINDLCEYTGKTL